VCVLNERVQGMEVAAELTKKTEGFNIQNKGLQVKVTHGSWKCQQTSQLARLLEV